MIRSSSRSFLRTALCPAVFRILFAVTFCFGHATAGAGQSLEAEPNAYAFSRSKSLVRDDIFPNNAREGRCFAVMDVDADGIDEVFVSKTHSVQRLSRQGLAWTVSWQVPAPSGFHGPPDNASFGLLAIPQLDDSGTPALLAVTSTPDGTTWRSILLDARTGTVINTFDFEGGPDSNGDNRWDGFYTPVSVFRDGAGATRVLYSVFAGYDVTPRGVLCVDPRNGDVVWSFDTAGPAYPRSIHVADLTGDPRPEIAAVWASVGNDTERSVNGFTDHEAVLFVLDSAGSLLWQRAVGGEGVLGFVASGDFDLDDRSELLVATRSSLEGGSSLRRFDALDGELLGNPVPVQAPLQLRVTSRHPSGYPVAYVSDQTGLIEAYRVTKGELVADERIQWRLSFWTLHLSPLLAFDEEEVIAADSEGGIWILDLALNPLANAKTATQRPVSWFGVVSGPEDQRELIAVSDRLEFIGFAETPSSHSTLRILLPVAFAVALPLALLLRRRSQRSRMSESSRRKMRLDLLDILELSRHGELGITQRIQRLLWIMRSSLAEDPRHSLDTPGAHFTDLTEIIEDILPQLATQLRQTRDSGLRSSALLHAIDQSDTVLANLESLLALCKAPLEAEGRITGVLEEVGGNASRLDAALIALRAECQTAFHSNLAPVLQNALRAHEESLRDVDVVLDAELQGERAEVICLFDRSELGFVLENLVANATRAMADSAVRRLSIRHRKQGGLLSLEIEDTGCGMPAENFDRVLDSRFSTREGGGSGLFRSRQMLARFGGTIKVLRSAEGEGTIFLVEIPLARSG